MGRGGRDVPESLIRTGFSPPPGNGVLVTPELIKDASELIALLHARPGNGFNLWSFGEMGRRAFEIEVDRWRERERRGRERERESPIK